MITHDCGGFDTSRVVTFWNAVSHSRVSADWLFGIEILSRFSLHQSSVLSLSVAPVRVWLRLRTLSLVKLTPMFYLHRQYHHLMWQCCFVFVCYLLKYTDNQYSRSVFQTQFYSYDLWTLSLSLLAAEDLLLKNTQTDKDLSETKCSVCSFETKAFHFVLFFISIIYIYIFFYNKSIRIFGTAAKEELSPSVSFSFCVCVCVCVFT